MATKSKKAKKIQKIWLACTDCKRRNYHLKKNSLNMPEKLQLKKYCSWCRKHTMHKETK